MIMKHQVEIQQTQLQVKELKLRNARMSQKAANQPRDSRSDTELGRADIGTTVLRSRQVTGNTPQFRVLLRELHSIANEWENIGILLDIKDGQLEQIKMDNAGDSKACLREMLRVWLSRVAPPPSWSAMADALDTLGHQDIATHLRSSYC